MRYLLNKCKKRVFFLLLVLATASLLCFAVHQLHSFSASKQDILTALSKNLNRQVTAKTVRFSWRGLDPEIDMDRVQIHPFTCAASTCRFQRVRSVHVQISWWRSLLYWHWVPAVIQVEGLRLVIHRLASKKYNVQGWGTIHFAKHGEIALSFNSSALKQSKIEFSHCDIDYITQHQHVELIKADFHYMPHFLAGVQFELTGQLARHVDRHVVFRGKIQNLLSRHPVAHYFLRLENMDLALLQQLLVDQGIHYPAVDVAGVADMSLFASYNHSGWDRVKYTGEIHHFQARWPQPVVRVASKKRHVMYFQDLKADAIWQRSDRGWRLRLRHIKANTGRRVLPLRRVEYSVNYNNKHVGWRKLSLDRFDLKDWAAVKSFIPSARVAGFPVSVLQRGRGHFSRIQMSSFSPLSWGRISASFSSLYLPPYRRFPGVANLSGDLSFGVQGGWMNMDGVGAEILLTSQSKPIWLRHFTGRFFYRWKDHQMRYFLQDLDLSNDDMQLTGSVNMRKKKNASPKLDIGLFFHFNRLSKIKEYIPPCVVHRPLQQWLSVAFKGGKLINGRIRYRGRWSRFPNGKGRDRLSVQASLRNLQLKFAPAWPVLMHARGQLFFTGRSMSAVISAAQIDGNGLRHLVARIGDLTHKPTLNIAVQSFSGWKDGLRFIHDSPLLKVNDRLKKLSLRGKYRLGLKLKVPLSGPSHLHCRGDLLLQRDTLQPMGTSVVMDKVRGHLVFTTDTIHSDLLRARLFGRPVNMRLSTTSGAHRQAFLHVLISGAVLVQTLFHRVVSHFISGILPYRVALDLPLGDARYLLLKVSSSFRGVKVSRVPRYWLKPPAQVMPSTLSVQIAGQHVSRVQFHYGQKLHGDVVLQSKLTSRFHPVVNLSLGNTKLSPHCEGVCLVGDIPFVRVLSLQKLYRFFSPRFGVAGNPLRLMSRLVVRLKLDRVMAWGRLYNQVLMSIHPAWGGWDASLVSGHRSVHIVSPNRRDAQWVVKASHWDFLQGRAGLFSHFSAIHLPAVDLMLKDIHFGLRDIKLLRWQDVKLLQGNGVSINHFQLVLPLVRFVAHGFWYDHGSQKGVHLKGTAAWSNVGAFLKQVSDWGGLKKGSAKAHFLYYSAQPSWAWLNSGTLDLLFVSHGGELSVPTSAARSLGLLKLVSFFDIEAIPQHVKTGLSDLSDQQLQLLSLRGHVLVRHQMVFVDHLRLSSVSLGLYASGRINERLKTCDMVLTVSPHITSSVPLLSGFVGGPVVGVVTWVLNSFLKNDIDHKVSVRYHVFGSLNHPVVVKVGRRF